METSRFHVCERVFLDISDFMIENSQQNGSLARIKLIREMRLNSSFETYKGPVGRGGGHTLKLNTLIYNLLRFPFSLGF